ncbi:MAG: outer membrane lipoprotein-sorting protein [Firmicutes bacterium]|nr:outer membrane lipoprotein-sorting protein [Bacillota bacterium]
MGKIQRAMRAKVIIAAFAFAAAGATGSLAADLSADEILDRMEGKTEFLESGSATIELVTINQRGQERSNRLKFYRKETANGASQLLEYLTPADVAGTKFLSIDGDDGETMMWLYLPALGRERRIAGSAAQDNFMGTDFTFEEIGGAGTFTRDYDAERLADEAYEDKEAYVLRLTPRESDSKYGFVKMWVWKDHFVPLRVEFYNKRGTLDKVLVNEDLRQNAKGEWQSHLITMSSENSGTRTIVRVLETDDAEVPDEYFTLRYLRR